MTAPPCPASGITSHKRMRSGFSTSIRAFARINRRGAGPSRGLLFQLRPRVVCEPVVVNLLGGAEQGLSKANGRPICRSKHREPACLQRNSIATRRRCFRRLAAAGRGRSSRNWSKSTGPGVAARPCLASHNQAQPLDFLGGGRSRLWLTNVAQRLRTGRTSLVVAYSPLSSDGPRAPRAALRSKPRRFFACRTISPLHSAPAPNIALFAPKCPFEIENRERLARPPSFSLAF